MSSITVCLRIFLYLTTFVFYYSHFSSV